MKTHFLATLLLSVLVFGCKPRTQELRPQTTNINPDVIEQAKTYFENAQSVALTKTVEVSLGARDNRINLWAYPVFRTFQPIWSKTEQVTLLNGNKVLITPISRNMKVDYNNLYYIRRLRIELNTQNQVVKANIVELVTLKHTVASQKYQIIANVFEEIQTRTDAKILVFDAGYTPQIESGSWKGETTNTTANLRPTSGSDSPGCYQLVAVVSCSDVQYLQEPAPCSADMPGAFQGFGTPINNCPNGGGSPWTPPSDPNNPPGSGQTGNGGGDNGQDQPLDPNFTPDHIEDPEGIYKEYKTYISAGLTGTKEYINTFSTSENPQVQAMVSFMRKKLDAYEQAEKDIKLIEKSTYKYFFKSMPPEVDVNGKYIPQGETYYDIANNKIVVAFPQNVGITAAVVLGLKAHEMRHVGQFETGKLSYSKTPDSEGKGKGGVLYDLQDEVDAYKIQYILMVNFHDNGKIDFLGKPAPNFVVNNTTVLASGIYNSIPTTQITIKTKPEGTTLQNATNPTDIFVKP
ncbi:hypothetical protein AD998_06020 [bacterium 336/3]|nr:hypothetical protein AD998_06020 [bacterium 336/3]